MTILQSVTQGFLRPLEIEFTALSNLQIECVGGAHLICTPNEGVHASMLTLAYEVNVQAVAVGFSAYLDTDFKLCIKSDDGTDVSFTTFSEFSRMLGFTGAETPGPVLKATYTPLYCWLPTHHSFDGSRWWRDTGDRFKGELGVTGGKFGVTLPARYRRAFQYSTNYSANTFHEAERDYYTVSAVDYYPAAERSFEEFIDGASTVQTLHTSSGNVSAKGVYYIDRLYEYCGETPTRALPSSMDAGGIHFDIDTAAKRDNYLFCQVARDTSSPSMTDSRTAAYYEPSFELVSDLTPDTVAFTTGSIGR